MVEFNSKYIIVAFCLIFIVLLSRILLVLFPKLLFSRWIDFSLKRIKIIIWRGLRGGLSLALVLSLPKGESQNILLIASYLCVVFSILVQ